jgi:hypothetical protein
MEIQAAKMTALPVGRSIRQLIGRQFHKYRKKISIFQSQFGDGIAFPENIELFDQNVKTFFYNW